MLRYDDARRKDDADQMKCETEILLLYAAHWARAVSLEKICKKLVPLKLLQSKLQEH